MRQRRRMYPWALHVEALIRASGKLQKEVAVCMEVGESSLTRFLRQPSPWKGYMRRLADCLERPFDEVFPPDLLRRVTSPPVDATEAASGVSSFVAPVAELDVLPTAAIVQTSPKDNSAPGLSSPVIPTGDPDGVPLEVARMHDPSSPPYPRTPMHNAAYAFIADLDPEEVRALIEPLQTLIKKIRHEQPPKKSK